MDCHGNGHCSDSLQGNGECVCTIPFTGLECDKCNQGNRNIGTHCNEPHREKTCLRGFRPGPPQNRLY